MVAEFYETLNILCLETYKNIVEQTIKVMMQYTVGNGQRI